MVNPILKTVEEPTPHAPDESALMTSHYRRLVPNILTLLALTAGMTAIQMSIDGHWDKAALAIVIAGFLDMLDGAMARLLKATSPFGAELDSLSDFMAFGVAPATILYLWVLEESGKIGWIAMIVFAVASALRLARYNVTPKPKTGVWSKGFFAGVPAPGGAGMAMLPLFIWLMAPEIFENLAWANFAVGIWVIFCAAMMVSRIPTWSSKQIKFKSKMMMPILALAAFVIAALIQAPWPTLTIISLTYISSIPFAIHAFRKAAKADNESFDMTALAIGVTDSEESIIE